MKMRTIKGFTLEARHYAPAERVSLLQNAQHLGVASELTHADWAEMFQVHIRTIYRDLKVIRCSQCELLKQRKP